MKKENKTAIGYLALIVITTTISTIVLSLMEWDGAEVIFAATGITMLVLIMVTKVRYSNNTSDAEKKNRDLINTTAMLGGFPPTIS